MSFEGDQSPHIYNLDRKQALRQVEQALSEGRIDYEDFDELSGVIAHTNDKAQLDEIVARVQHVPALPAQARPAHPLAPQRSAPSETAFLGNLKRQGRWIAEDGMKFQSVGGDILLDLRDAEPSAAEITLHANAWLGNVCVVVCPGVRVIDNINAVLGSKKFKASAPVPGAATVRLEGTCLMGTVKVISRDPGTSLPFGFVSL